MVGITSDSSKLSTLTTIIATLPGHSESLVGTDALQTISSYSLLHEHITTTLTASSPATDETVGIETAVAVVLAGGVSWFTVGELHLLIFVPVVILIENTVGIAGDTAGESALEPPKDAKDGSDDNACPNSESECAECGGATAAMRTTGKDIGCAWCVYPTLLLDRSFQNSPPILKEAAQELDTPEEVFSRSNANPRNAVRQNCALGKKTS